jgi:hypothetical protein
LERFLQDLGLILSNSMGTTCLPKNLYISKKILLLGINNSSHVK